jgi:hypothetical protein
VVCLNLQTSLGQQLRLGNRWYIHPQPFIIYKYSGCIFRGLIYPRETAASHGVRLR